MKKILTIITGIMVGLPSFASAATFVVATSTDMLGAGDTTTLNISVDPEGATMYTAMLDARFSTDTLEVVSFTHNDKMLVLKQDGYDALDNATGSLIKTGGYPGGINTVSPFGTVVVRAKKSGTATLTVTDKSLLLDSKNVDQQKGEKSTEFVIASQGTTVPTVATENVAQETVATTAPTRETSVITGAQSTRATTQSSGSTPASAPTPIAGVAGVTDSSVATAGDSSSSLTSVAQSGVTAPITQLAAVIVANAGENSLALGILALLLVLILSFYIAHTRNLFAGVVSRFRK